MADFKDGMAGFTAQDLIKAACSALALADQILPGCGVALSVGHLKLNAPQMLSEEGHAMAVEIGATGEGEEVKGG